MKGCALPRLTIPLLKIAPDRRENLVGLPLNLVEAASNSVHAFIIDRAVHQHQQVSIGIGARITPRTRPVEDHVSRRFDLHDGAFHLPQQYVTSHALITAFRPLLEKTSYRSKRTSPPTMVFSTLPRIFQP